MTKRKLALAAVLGVLAAVVAAFAVGASAGTAGKSAPFKAAWIYVGPHNDGGWSQAHDQGRLMVQKALGSKVQTTFKENVPEGPQVAQVIDSLIRDGNKIIFATSFGFQPAMAAAAKKHPDVKFEMATGTTVLPNMSEYFGAGEEAIYLSGMAAGAASKSGNIGYVVPFAIPEVIRHTNAFALGAQYAHPGAKVHLVWMNAWFDPAKEKKAAESLHSAGADVLGQNVDSPATGQYAESVGVPWVGYDSNAQKFAPTSWLTGAVYNWGPYYLKRTVAAMKGTWKTGNYYGNMKDGFTKLAPYGKNVTAATKQLIAQQKALIVSGKWNEFSGPIYDQSGKLRIKPGHRASFADLMSMDYLVRGVIGSPKG